MCGIVGLYIKNPELEKQLGKLFAPMLICMTGRGPDSAGVALYDETVADDSVKITLYHPDEHYDWRTMQGELEKTFNPPILSKKMSTHMVMTIKGRQDAVRDHILQKYPEVAVVSIGQRIEILKEVGTPEQVVKQFDVENFTGSHMLGHTRMATESAVTTSGSHPFSTGNDLCLVHNGSLSNHNRLRDNLRKRGVTFQTQNDSEVAAGYLTWKLREGNSLEEALQAGLKDLDGFYTFAIGTREGFAVLRDPISCKPAVMAETDDYVAMASEFQSLASLPGVNEAKLWEPEPGRIYSWSKTEAA